MPALAHSVSLKSIAAVLGGGRAFTPASLFAASEPGGWYDPSDLTTLYQDAAGTTPVTAVEQPVGLVLDKSRGLVLGSELVTNGDFSNGTTGWASSSGYASSAAVVSGELQITATVAYGRQIQTIACVVGRTYKVSCTARVVSGSVTALIERTQANGGGLGPFAPTTSTTNVTLSFVFTAINTTEYIVIGSGSPNSGQVMAFDNISVRELPGAHLSQSTAAARPVLSARVNALVQTEDFSNAAWTKDSLLAFGSGSTVNATAAPNGTTTADLITSASATTQTGVGQSVAFAAAAYTWTVSVKPNGARYVQLLWGGSASSNYANFDLQSGIVTAGTYTAATITSEANGFFRIAITSALSAASSAAFLWFVDSGTAARAAAFTGDGVKGIYIWGADLRPANAGVGLPAYQRVGAATSGSSTAAGNADYNTTGFPYYLRWDGTDDGMASSSIDFSSTDKVAVFAGVRKLSDASAGIIAELSASTVTNSGAFVLANYNPNTGATSNLYSFISRGSVYPITAPFASGYASPITSVNTGLGNISGDSAILRVNGSQAASDSGDQGTGNFGNYPLFVGSRNNASSRFNGHIYGLVVVGRALTAAEISSMESWMAAKTGVTL